jgi:putative hydrolase of the HAD superfamily
LRFVDRFRVILLDMMGTFMFGGDRFAEGEDYARTYRALGGGGLGDAQVCAVIGEVFRRMLEDYENPARQEGFAPVRSYLEEALPDFGLPRAEAVVLDEVFAAHETGRVPEAHARVLRRLRRTHRLGVVSNLWCPGGLCLEEFRRAGVAELFEAVVFSSDYRINKPSPLLFRKALERFGVSESEVLFVGDDLARDIAGAKATGLAAVWINDGSVESDVEDFEVAARPDLVIKDLVDLLGP